jgi:hypothetical protein
MMGEKSNGKSGDNERVDWSLWTTKINERL